METELADAPITPTILSGLAKTGGSPFAQRTSEPSRSMSAWTKVSDCSRAYVSREQVSRMRAPRVTLGSSSGSLLMRSMAKSMASSRWMPFSFFSSPQGTPRSPRACTGNRPPRMMSPSIRMEWAYSTGRGSKRWENDDNQQQISTVRRSKSLYCAQFRLVGCNAIVILQRNRRIPNHSTKMAVVMGGTIHVHILKAETKPSVSRGCRHRDFLCSTHVWNTCVVTESEGYVQIGKRKKLGRNVKPQFLLCFVLYLQLNLQKR